MESQKFRYFLIILSLFLWAHYVPIVADLPWTNPEDLEINDTQLANSKYLLSTDAYGPEYGFNDTVMDMEQALIKGAMYEWVESGILLLLGIYSVWLIYLNSKYWQYLILILSGYVCVTLVPGVISLVSIAPTLIEYFSWLVKNVDKSFAAGDMRHGYVTISIHLVPALFVVLMICSAHVIFKRLRNASIAA